MHTSEQWWNEVKKDPEKLASWLKRQYIGEIAAVNLLSEVLIKYGSEATEVQWLQIHKVMIQEAVHGKWMKRLMDDRGIKLEPNGDATRRYWAEVLPGVTNFQEAMAAAFQAEHMRLARIRTIANDKEAPEDIRLVFQSILPHEEWHEEVFGEMRGTADVTRYHEKGLEALNLLLV